MVCGGDREMERLLCATDEDSLMVCSRSWCLDKWRNRGRFIEETHAPLDDSRWPLGHIRDGGDLLNVEVDRAWEESKIDQLVLTYPLWVMMAAHSETTKTVMSTTGMELGGRCTVG